MKVWANFCVKKTGTQLCI